jgi:hypothetical protein
VQFSFLRYRWPQQQRDKIREIEIVAPYRVRFHLHTPWPAFLTYYGCGTGRYGNAATRLEEMAVTWGSTGEWLL